MRELELPGVEITTPTNEFSAPIAIEIEVVSEELRATTLEFAAEAMDVRELEGPGVEITALKVLDLRLLGRKYEPAED